LIFKQETDKLQLGASSRPEVAAALTQTEQFRVSRAQTQRDVADAERELRVLIGAPLEDGKKIIPTTLPVLDEQEIDWEQAVLAASHSRPEIQLQNSALHLAQLRKFSSHDGLRPDVRAYAGWGLSGTDGNFNRSFQTMTSGDYQNWWTGVIYQKQLGGRTARSLDEQARLGLARERAAHVMVEQDIYQELHAAHQRITNAWEVMQLSSDRRAAATEVLEARREMHALGEMSLQDYLSALSAWEQSIADQRQSVAEYNAAIVTWEYAKGSILDYQNIDFPSSELSDEVPAAPNEMQSPPKDVPPIPDAAAASEGTSVPAEPEEGQLSE
jgi:outer membrane protein TolC